MRADTWLDLVFKNPPPPQKADFMELGVIHNLCHFSMSWDIAISKVSKGWRLNDLVRFPARELSMSIPSSSLSHGYEGLFPWKQSERCVKLIPHPCLGLTLILRGLIHFMGHAIAQAVSRRLHTAEARVQTRVWSCGILWWTKVALG
jgi:hypothetical protein